MIQKYLSVIFLIFLFIVGCDSKTNEMHTYFGGKIINPKSDYVVLYSQDNLIDSFAVDKKGNFIGKLSNINEGLYYFSHDNENQHIYLEPQDSLMLRLNTWDFDETLVFAGKGSERNNILIDCFLEQERERRLFYQLYKLNPDRFKEEANSILEEKLETYNAYIQRHPYETEGYKKVLKVALTYPIFSNNERYPVMHVRATGIDSFPKLDSIYYNYRSALHINNDSLMYFPPYAKYVRNYLYNETYSLGHKPMFASYSPEFTIDLLETIDNKIESEKSKNAFLKQTVINHFYNKSSCNIDEKTFTKFYQLSSDEDDIAHVKDLVRDTKSIIANNQIVDFHITDFLNKEHSFRKVTKGKSTFVFFWNPEYVSESYIAARINYLKNKYDNIQFLQVNIDLENPSRIKNLDIKNQFYLQKDSKANEFLSSKMPRSILIDNKGKVVNGFASISSQNLYPFLQKLNQ